MNFTAIWLVSHNEYHIANTIEKLYYDNVRIEILPY